MCNLKQLRKQKNYGGDKREKQQRLPVTGSCGAAIISEARPCCAGAGGGTPALGRTLVQVLQNTASASLPVPAPLL